MLEFLPTSDDALAIEKIEAGGKLKVAGFARLKDTEYAVVACLLHPSDKWRLVRKDNALSGQGAVCCGRKEHAGMSADTFARARIDRSVFDDGKASVKTVDTNVSDRSMVRVLVQGTILQASVAVEARLKNAKVSLAKVRKRIESIRERHGDFVKVRVSAEGAARPSYQARCVLTGQTFDGYSQIMDAAPRALEATRNRLIALQAPDPLELLLPSRSAPHELVRRLMLELTGLAPREEQKFAGLRGEHRFLRLDMFFSGLGRCGVVIEVQSVIHEQEVAFFGGAEGYRKRVAGDENKHRHFLGGNGTLPQLICIRGDWPEHQVRSQVEKALASLRNYSQALPADPAEPTQ